MSVALPFSPAEHDGRLPVQFGMPKSGHDVGASTPLQLVQVPPLVAHPPVSVQLENPETPATVQ